MGYDRNQYHYRSLSTRPPGHILKPKTPTDNHSLLRSLCGSESSNQIYSSKKTKNAPPERPIEVHIMNEALYNKIQYRTTFIANVRRLYKPILVTGNNRIQGNIKPAHVSQQGI